MKEPKKIFEPITVNQTGEIYRMTKELPPETLEKMLIDLISIPDVNALSKQEASHIIERLHGPPKWPTPKPPRTEDKIKRDTSDMPFYGHIFFIRESVKALGWGLHRFQDWLFKYTGQTSIRNLNRKKTLKVYVMLVELRKQRN